ncbi:MAG: HNH endonuclease [Lachnospiraceae bacterium]|nr:HNH endonuclease [Lachnospiraceae bacterium]
MGFENLSSLSSEMVEKSVNETSKVYKDIDKRIDVSHKTEEMIIGPEATRDIDKRIDVKSYGEKLYTTYQERLIHTPKNNWSGKRGESLYILQDEDSRKLLEIKNLDGIEYKDGIPNFDSISEGTCKIKSMTKYREDYYDEEKGQYIEGNFTQYDKIMKETLESKGFQLREVKCSDGRIRTNWFDSNGIEYTRHEKNDMKTMQLVPRKIHEECKHSGGVAEIKALERTKNQ